MTVSPFVRQGALELAVFTGFILAAYAAISLAGGERLYWFLIPAYVPVVAVRTVWRMQRHRRPPGENE